MRAILAGLFVLLLLSGALATQVGTSRSVGLKAEAVGAADTTEIARLRITGPCTTLVITATDDGIATHSEAPGANGIGVKGLASSTTGTNYGVYGITASTTGWAAFFEGPIGCSQQNYKPLNLSWAEGGTVVLSKTNVVWTIAAGADRRMLLDGAPTILDGARTVVDSMNITFTIPTIADSIDVEIYGVDVIGGVTLLTNVGWLGGNNGITGQQTLAVAAASAAYRSYMVWIDTAVGTNITFDGAALFYRRNTVAVTIP